MAGGIVAALAFLTRLPVGRLPGADGGAERGVTWFPLVGAVVGAVVATVAIVAGVVLTPLVAASLAVAAGMAVTGAFHEDGLADTADGFGGGWTVDERLRIMSDSRLGTYGVAALVVSIVVRIGAVAALDGLEPGRILALVVGAHLLARTWMVVTLVAARPVKTSGLASTVRARAARRQAAVAAIAWAAVGLAASGPTAFALMSGAGLVLVGLVLVLAYRRVGGVTGDVLGTVEQVGEIGALVAASSLAS